MRNKKGFLLAEETLKIVIAVICIGFLVYLLTSLYLKNKDNEKLEQAEASLEHLISEINAEHTEVDIYNPKGWVLSSWASPDMPNSCSNMGWDNCICICDNPGVKDLIIDIFTSRTQINSYKNKCDEKGVCKQLTKKMIVGDSSKQYAVKIVDPPLVLEIKEDIITKK